MFHMWPENSSGLTRMYVLFLVTLLWPRTAHGGSATPEWTYCHHKQFCLHLSERQISAEAGLCAVIHCSFKTPQNFKPSSLVWFKCESGRKCGNSDIIFNSKKRSKIQASFSGRVSLLEPDLNQRNCSIIINDLQLSDSGEYQLRVNKDNNGFSFSDHRATVSVRALQQKPSVLSPALTEGQRASLSCTAPGLCSGSEPTFTWTWREAGEANITKHINITMATTDQLTPVNHRHRSSLELMPSSELHGAEFSCTVFYNHGTISTQDSVRINVTYVKEIEVSGDTAVKEGDSLNVTCSVDSFPPSQLMWFGPNKTSLNVLETTERSGQTDLGSASLLIHNVTQAQSGQYMCEGLHLNSFQTKDINISVKLKPHILKSSGCVHGRDVLSCTCVSRASPVPTVSWPLLQHLSEYTLVTAVTGYTVNSSLVLRASEHNTTGVQCVSSNSAGQVQQSFTPSISTGTAEGDDSTQNIIETVFRLEVLLAFGLGFLLSSALCCFVMTCRRKKQRSQPPHGDITTLELDEKAEEANASAEPRELHYANIDFSAMVGKGHRDRQNIENATKTEYAEIKKKTPEQTQDEGEVREETPGEVEAAMMEEKMTSSQSEPDKQEDSALYSNVKEIMAAQ